MTLVVRPGSSDLPQLSRILGGLAAAPPEWEAWAEEPGHALVAEADGRPVGGVHVSMVGRNEAWVENLRVHPEFQGQGIARSLVREAEQVARHYGGSVIRTAIPAHDYAAQTVADRAGYRRVSQSVVVETAIDPGPMYVPYDAPVTTPLPARAPEVWGLVDQLPTVQAWDHLLPLGWRFRRAVPELVRGLLKDRRVRVAGAQEAVCLFAVRDEAVILSLIDGTPSGVQAVFGAVIEHARSEGVDRVVVFAADTRSLASFGGHSWQPHAWCPDGVTVVEKSLAS